MEAGSTDIMTITADRWKRCESGDVRMMLTGQVFAIMSGTAKRTDQGNL